MNAQKWFPMQLKKIVLQSQAQHINGYFIDLQTANLVFDFYTKISASQKRKIVQIPIEDVSLRLWRALSV